MSIGTADHYEEVRTPEWPSEELLITGIERLMGDGNSVSDVVVTDGQVSFTSSNGATQTLIEKGVYYFGVALVDGMERITVGRETAHIYFLPHLVN